jgi:Glycosyltransferase family 87
MRVLGVVAFAAGLLVMLRSAFPMDAGVDYFSDASAAIDALARGDLDSYFHQAPLMGPFSLLLRAPFVRLVFDSSVETVYFAGVVPCLAAVAGLAYALRRRMTELGRPAAAITLVTIVALLNTGVFRSVHWGHPEEVLGGALCVSAVLAGLRDRALLAGLLLGLAVATKQWAVIAVIPTLLATSHRRIALLLVTGAIGGALTLPSILVKPDTFVAVHKQAALAGGPVAPANIWMPFASPRSAEAREASSQGFAYEIPTWLSGLTHPAIVLAGLPLGLLFWLRRRTLEREDALGLLALLFLIRCVADPWNNDYYHAPFLLALLSWEALARDGWPRLTVFAGAALATTFPATLVTMSQMSAEPLRYCLGYLVWALPLAGWLALSLFAPTRAAAITAVVRSRLPGRLDRRANVARA